jgi:glyoxylase-like metal-dependent hydrolase (beta-lactamase superfamily II)
LALRNDPAMSLDIARLDAHNPGPMTGQGNNTYLIAGGNGRAALIDAGVGHPKHLTAISQHLTKTMSDLERVLVTHAHADHVAGVTAISSQHPGTVFFKWAWPDEDARYKVEWRDLSDGEAVDAAGQQLIAIHTPGHSPDHVVFWHELSRTVFTGDLVVPGASVVLQTSRGADLAAYLSSLRRVLALTPTRLLPAHGPEVANPKEVLTAHADHRLMRERQVLAALGKGCETVQAIVESIYDGLDAALKPAAAENVKAHLDKLRREGRALEHDGRWTS